MALLIIKKGNEEKTATPGAYKNYFKRLGWEAVEGFKPEPVPDNDDDDDESGDGTVSDLTDEEILEIPVDEMSNVQVKRAAGILGIDFKAMGIKKPKDVKVLIKEKLAEG
jgi:hypothetical protein